MPLPNLIRPIVITVSPVSRPTTNYDRDAREPIRTARRSAAIKIDGQVSYSKRREARDNAVGPAEEYIGRVTVRSVDLTAAGWTPLRGDLFTAFGGTTVNYYITNTEDRGHWGDQGGPTLLMCFFSDRRPTATTPTR